MKNVFSDKIELKRLAVQRNLLWEYEAPVYQRIIQDRKNMVLLDVGCNDGRKTIERFDRKNFAKVVGLDCLTELVEEAGQAFGDDVFSFYYCDVAQENFAEAIKAIMEQEKIASFDIINCSFLLMHLEEPGRVLEGLRQFLAPEGILVVIEPEDTTSKMQPDPENIFGQFLDTLARDPYAGQRDCGNKVFGLLQQSGYKNIALQLAEITAHKGEGKKKEDIFTTFCSYLPEDMLLLQQEAAGNDAYQACQEWVQNNFADLRRLITAPETEIAFGMKIYTCGGKVDAY